MVHRIIITLYSVSEKHSPHCHLATNFTIQLFLYTAVTTVIGFVEIKHTWQKLHTYIQSDQLRDIWNNTKLIWRLVKLHVFLLIIGHVSVGVFGFKMASGSSRWVSLSMLAEKSILHLRPFENNCVEIQCIAYYFVMKWVYIYIKQECCCSEPHSCDLFSHR